MNLWGIGALFALVGLGITGIADPWDYEFRALGRLLSTVGALLWGVYFLLN